MTSTASPPTTPPPATPTGGPGGSEPSPRPRQAGTPAASKSSARRTGDNPEGEALVLATLTVAAGVGLTMLPMRSVFTDWVWLSTSIACAIPYLAVVIAFRWRGRRRGAPVLLGLAAAALVMCWVFTPEHLLLGVLPTRASWPDVQALLRSAHDSMQSDRAPVHSTPGLRLLTAGAAVLLVAIADVLGILLRKPLLAAAPLLEVLAVASATSSKPANPVFFAGAATGFLLILVACTRLLDREWGPSVDGSAGRLGGARRIATTAILAALIVPVILPSVSVNVLARATHHNGGNGGSGKGQSIELNTTADLSGSLRRGSPVDLIKVTVGPSDRPFYIRQVVLDEFTSTGWVQSPPNRNYLQSLFQRDYPLAPGSVKGTADTGATQPIMARFTIVNLSGTTLPLLAYPSQLDPIGGTSAWDQITGTVLGARVTRNLSYTEQVNQPVPSDTQLQSAPDWTPTGVSAVDQRMVALPAGMPPEVKTLAGRLTAGLSNSYDKARAISDYFTDPKNGFVYSLDTAPDDGRNALVTFLDKKRGFCQQYAAAAAALMREIGLPARVVLGYTHHTPDFGGSFTVTTADAHAWVEVYFTGVGWVPFDPTPLSGTDTSRAIALPWAPHPTSSASSSNGASSASSSASAAQRTAKATDTAAAGAAGGGSRIAAAWRAAGIALAVLLALAALLSGPRLIRFRQRRRRFARARSNGDPEPLWEELAASAADRGTLWPDTLTVGQVPEWLAGRGVDERGRAALGTVARDVERARYSASDVRTSVETVLGLDQAIRRWERRVDRRHRLGNWWLPRSLTRRSEITRR